MEILVYWWVVVTHNTTQVSNRRLSYLNSKAHGDFIQQVSLEFPYASFFETVKSILQGITGIKFPFEVSQHKNANLKNQFSCYLPWDYLMRTTDLLKTGGSKTPLSIFIMMYQCCSLMCVGRTRESLHRNRPVVKVFQNRTCSKICPQLPPAISSRVLYKTLAEDPSSATVFKPQTLRPHTQNLSFYQGSCKHPSFGTTLPSGISKDWATQPQTKTRQPHPWTTSLFTCLLTPGIACHVQSW